MVKRDLRCQGPPASGRHMNAHFVNPAHICVFPSTPSPLMWCSFAGSSSKENAASSGVASKDAASDAQLTACRVCRGVQLFCEAPDCIELGCADEDCSAAVKTEFSKCADSRCESSEHKEGAFCKVHAEKALYACDDCGDLTCWPQQCLYCDKMTCGGCVRMKCECIERPYRYQAYESELEDDEDSADAYGVLLDADDSLFADDDSCM